MVNDWGMRFGALLGHHAFLDRWVVTFNRYDSYSSWKNSRASSHASIPTSSTEPSRPLIPGISAGVPNRVERSSEATPMTSAPWHTTPLNASKARSRQRLRLKAPRPSHAKRGMTSGHLRRRCRPGAAPGGRHQLPDEATSGHRGGHGPGKGHTFARGCARRRRERERSRLD